MKEEYPAARNSGIDILPAEMESTNKAELLAKYENLPECANPYNTEEFKARLIEAAKSFDIHFGTVFSTYAVPLIIGEIRRFLRDDGIIKVSRDIRKKGMLIMKAKEDYMKEHQQEPKISELPALCEMTMEEVVYALDAVYPVYSLQDTLGSDDDGATLEQMTPADENEIEKMTDRLALSEAIAKLDRQSQMIIQLRFYKDLSQQQTAEILGITQVKVSREEKKIFAFLRKELNI
jgi:RNA polymerase sporulation-specific sigma factor